MGTDLRDGFAINPMVEEGEATGAVPAVYVDILERLPMVPSLYKSLAACPHYLAWEQSVGILGKEPFAVQGRQLSASVRDVTRPPD